MASSSFPARVHSPLVEPSVDGGNRDRVEGLDEEGESSDSNGTPQEGYTARLLLFSFRNVDKHLKPHDPTVLQRLEMMLLLAKDVEGRTGQEVGIGLVDEPTFAGKDRVVREWLDRHIAQARSESSSSRSDELPSSDQPHTDAPFQPASGIVSNEPPRETPSIELTFLLGTDTLIRFFEPKYYPPGEMMTRLTDFFSRSSIVSAQRGEDDVSQGVEAGVLTRPEVAGFVKSGKVRLTGTFKEGREDVSSTRVREAVKKGEKDVLRELVSGDIADYIERERLYT
jgi:nicotinamide-nucleotide adenylyltransferase